MIDKHKWMFPGDKLICNEFMSDTLDNDENLVYTTEEFESHFSKWKVEKGYKLYNNMK